MRIAIAVCTYKRPRQLERLLLLLSGLKTDGLGPADLRLLIVDNSPDGRVRAVCERMGPLLPVGLDLVEEECTGRPYARNRAAEEAIQRGFDFVAFIDDDDEPELNWLKHLVAVQAASGADIVCGAMAPVLPKGAPYWMRSSPLFAPPRSDKETKHGIPRGIGTFNAMISVDLFRRLREDGEIFSGEFSYFEDTEFFFRAKAKGARFALAADSVVHRDFGDARTTFFGLLRYSWQLGKYNMVLLRKHAPDAAAKARLRKALRRVLCDVPKMVLRARSRGDVVRYLAGVAKEAGILAGAMTSRDRDAGGKKLYGLVGPRTKQDCCND